jgi:uncharacterized membrane protein
MNDLVTALVFGGLILWLIVDLVVYLFRPRDRKPDQKWLDQEQKRREKKTLRQDAARKAWEGK